MRKIPFMEAHITSTKEVARVSEALEISALALGGMLADEIKMIRLLSAQADSMEALLALQNAMVEAVNLAAEEEVSAYELKQRVIVLLSDYVLELESRAA